MNKPLCGELERALNEADLLATAEDAPAIRLDHFLFALIPAGALEDILEVYKSVVAAWRAEVGEVTE